MTIATKLSFISHRMVLAATIAATAPGSHAAELTFSRIGPGDQGLQQFWQLSPEEVQRYRNIMAATGERYKSASPLAVLSMMADSPEDKAYYARRAALHEHEMVKREIETAFLISEEMSSDALTKTMQRFTDGLTGINTADYVPDSINPEWRNGDWLVLYLDDGCLSAGCIDQYTAQMTGTIPEGIKGDRLVVVNSKIPVSEAGQTVIGSWPKTAIQHYDPIEHHYLKREGEKGSVALHIRDRNLIEVLAHNSTTSVPPAAAAAALATGPATVTAASGKTDTTTPTAEQGKKPVGKSTASATGKTTPGAKP